jgi:hypothetical protein
MKNRLLFLGILLLAQKAIPSHAELISSAYTGNKLTTVSGPSAMLNEQGDKSAPQQPTQTAPDPPVKAVPMTERKSKPQRVEENAETNEARGPRSARSARGSRTAAGGHGARGSSRSQGVGRGRGHN